MSLIEEALKKQRAETESAQSGAESAPAAPPPLPAAEAPAAPPRKPIWLTVAGVAVVILVLAAGFTYRQQLGGLLRVWRPGARQTLPVIAPTTVSGTNVLAPGATSVVQATSATADTNAAQPASQTATQEVASVPGPAIVSSATSTAQAAATAPETTPASPLFEPSPAQPVQPGETQAVVVVWPHLTISGLMGDSRGAKGAVIINGQILSMGDDIEGAQVVSVTKQGVVLRYAGETRTLKVGDSTD